MTIVLPTWAIPKTRPLSTAGVLADGTAFGSVDAGPAEEGWEAAAGVAVAVARANVAIASASAWKIINGRRR